MQHPCNRREVHTILGGKSEVKRSFERRCRYENMKINIKKIGCEGVNSALDRLE
jgi:hypothetical protein